MSRVRLCFTLVVTASTLGAFDGLLLAGTEVFTVTFDVGNHGRWSYFGTPANPYEVIETTGGNPGSYLHSTCIAGGTDCLDTFAPQPRTQLGTNSMFTGNYRDRGVVALGIDLILHDVDFSAGDRPLSLMLRNDNDTPGDEFDDLICYTVGPENIPLVGEGWKSFDFEVPSQNLTLPAGWVVQQGSGAGDDADWNAIITDVDQVIYFYGDPEFFFIFQQWEPGLDNPRIATDVPGFNPGDLNCDNSVDSGDVPLMVEALVDAANFGGCDINLADMNGDSLVDAGDITGFVDCVVNAICP